MSGWIGWLRICLDRFGFAVAREMDWFDGVRSDFDLVWVDNDTLADPVREFAVEFLGF